MNWNLFSKHRDSVYGISILSIILYHFCKNVIEFETGTSAFIANIYATFIGSIGVEIFLFLSGMGLFYSMMKNDDIWAFYKRRMIRVLIPYLIVAIPYFYFRDIIRYEESWITYLQNITFFSLFTEHETILWYIGLTLFTYLIYPFIFPLVKDGKNLEKKLVIGFLVLLGIYIFLQKFWTEPFNDARIAICRLSIFYAGCVYAPKIYYKQNFNRFDKVLFYLGLPIKLVCGYMEINGVDFSGIPERMVDFFFGLFMTATLTMILEKWKVNSKVLKLAGNYSLELYMLHMVIRSVMRELDYKMSDPINYAVCVLISIGLSWLLRKITDSIAKLLENHPQTLNLFDRNSISLYDK